jgi:undecaprenyl diphosphate synthase
MVWFNPELAKPGSKEYELLSAINPTKLPRHIAIIMDGNGRWAAKRGLPRISGHRAGVEAVRRVVEACAHLKIEVLTLYAFSAENWRRPEEEIEALWSLLREYLAREEKTLMENNILLHAIGRIEELPGKVKEGIKMTMAKTANNTGLKLFIALNYGGRGEIVDAVRKLCQLMREKKIEKVDEELISSLLYTKDIPDPDILIRTSGELRVSNFLLWQIAYTEFWVTETLWPDFTKKELFAAIHDYQKRERRYGGL